MRTIKKIIILSSSLFFLLPIASKAQTDIVITPQVIDEKMKPRDISKFNVKIKNNSDHKISLYAFVNDIDSSEGKQEFSSSNLDPTKSLAKWISIKRGVLEAMPGEEISVELKIDVTHNATPGKKHAVVTFSESSNRYDAEDKIQNSNQPKILVNVDISDMSVESAEVKSFQTTRNAYIKFPVSFDIEVSNFGNKTVKPFGSIYITNKRGQEVGEIKLNKGELVIDEEKTNKITLDWNGEKAFGKHKAKLSLVYGDKTKRDLQDTVYFWYFPKSFVLIALLILFGSVGILTWIIFKKTHQGHNQFVQEEDDKNHVLDLRD